LVSLSIWQSHENLVESTSWLYVPDKAPYILVKVTAVRIVGNTSRGAAIKLHVTNPLYKDEDRARSHLEALVWPDGPVCPHCASKRATALHGKAHREGLYQCNACREQFSVTVGTVFERSKIPLHKWILAAHVMAAPNTTVSAKQIARLLRLSYKSAWFVCHRIRAALGEDTAGPIGGADKLIEADESSWADRAATPTATRQSR
jgi:transposase-like protein